MTLYWSYRKEKAVRTEEQTVLHVVREDGDIDHGTARTIASWYNEPGIVATFVTTGALPQRPEISEDTSDDDLEELDVSGTLMSTILRGVSPGQIRENSEVLEALDRYLSNRDKSNDLGPVPGWSNMWVK